MILGEIALEADLPPGVLNIVTGDVDASRELTTNPMVDVVSFTGSEAVGRQVNRQAADTFKRDVNLVDLLFTVRDRNRSLVPHLSEQNCSVLDKKVPQTFKSWP